MQALKLAFEVYFVANKKIYSGLYIDFSYIYSAGSRPHYGIQRQCHLGRV